MKITKKMKPEIKKEIKNYMHEVVAKAMIER
jgi:hypothetical protein